MTALYSALPVLAVLALVFGPIASWLALRRQRQPIVWLVFGALLGPVALALLILAPVGICPQCDEKVGGWPTLCPACGEGLMLPAVTRLLELRGRPSGQPRLYALPIHPDVDAPPPIPPSRPTGTDSAGERVDSMDSISTEPEPGWAAHLATVARATAGSVANGAHPVRSDGNGGSPIGNGSAHRGSAFTRFQSDLLLPPRGPFEPEAEDPTIVAVGVYVSGSERLTIAGRYVIGFVAGRLRVLGPYETNPRKLALDWPLAEVRVGQAEGQLVLARGQNRRSRAVTFRLLSTFNRAALEEAITVATHDAEAAR